MRERDNRQLADQMNAYTMSSHRAAIAMKPPFFYLYLVFFAVALLMELVAIRRTDWERALVWLLAILLVLIGLLNARVWTM